MILNQLRTPVWAWDGKSESKCPMCGEPLVARRCKDRVWHWAHKPHTNQKENTCLFDDSEWALKWRLGYHMFDGWKIEEPKVLPVVALPPGTTVPPKRVILLHAINPTTKQVREFIGHINEANEGRFNFLLGAQNHNVMWMIDGKQWARALAKSVGNADRKGYKDFLKPKAQALYERICKAGQNALVHIDGPNGGTLYREWVKPAINDKVPAERTGIWYPCEGDRALAVLDNYSKVTLPYDNNKSEPTEKEAKKVAAAARFDKMLEAL